MSKKKTTKPTSPAKLAANQANAQQSTGPTSPEGKQRSGLNALKHGLLASQAIIRDDPAEDRDAFEALLEVLTAEYRPVGPTQCLLVERIAICHWRFRRALRFEAQCIHNDRVNGRCVGPRDDFLYTIYDAEGARGVLPAGRDFNRLVRYETMIDRQLNKLTDRLNQLRNESSSDPAQSPCLDSSSIPPPSAFSAAPSEIRDPQSPIPSGIADSPFGNIVEQALQRTLKSLGLDDDEPQPSDAPDPPSEIPDPQISNSPSASPSPGPDSSFIPPPSSFSSSPAPPCPADRRENADRSPAPNEPKLRPPKPPAAEIRPPAVAVQRWLEK